MGILEKQLKKCMAMVRYDAVQGMQCRACTRWWRAVDGMSAKDSARLHAASLGLPVNLYVIPSRPFPVSSSAHSDHGEKFEVDERGIVSHACEIEMRARPAAARTAPQACQRAESLSPFSQSALLALLVQCSVLWVWSGAECLPVHLNDVSWLV